MPPKKMVRNIFSYIDIGNHGPACSTSGILRVFHFTCIVSTFCFSSCSFSYFAAMCELCVLYPGANLEKIGNGFSYVETFVYSHVLGLCA
jgi:hypothetical protein